MFLGPSKLKDTEGNIQREIEGKMVTCWRKKFLFFFVAKHLHLVFLFPIYFHFLPLTPHAALMSFSVSREQRMLTYP